MTDRRIFFLAAAFRAVCIGYVGVVLGIYLARIGLNTASAGIVISCGLAGAAVASLFATFLSHRFSTRAMLIAVSLLSAAGTVAVALTSSMAMLAAASFVGMLNGMGRDRGAALILEQARLPATTDDHSRTRVFAWYNVLQDAGHALGGLAAGLPALLIGYSGISQLTSQRAGLAVTAGLWLLIAAAYTLLSPANARPSSPVRQSVTPATRRTLFKISSLFSLDSLGGGFLTTALVSYFFFERFGTSEAMIGLLFFVARIANALSHLGAAWLAARIGLVNTMVFTHIPSSILLVTVAIAPTFPVAAILFVLRESLVEMDVPTRQSYVMAVVKPEERVVASGVTQLVRMGMWAVAPALAGWLMQDLSLGIPLIIGAALKIVYDILLYFSFRHLRPPEERP